MSDRFSERFRAWWETRSARERGLFGVAAALAAVVLAWLLVVRPLDAWRAAAKDRHDAAVFTLARVEARLAAIEAARTDPVATPEGPIRDLVLADAVRVGFNTAESEPMGADGVRVFVGAVRPQAFFAWVADMENRFGLDVDALTARPNSDQTLSVEVTFRRGRTV